MSAQISEEELFKLGQQVLVSQPFSVLVGAVLTKMGTGEAEIQIPIKDDLKQQYGFVHGGVISYAADNAMAFAGGSVLGKKVVTAEIKLTYLRPCVGAQLAARAFIIRQGNRSAVCRCDVYSVNDEGEQLVAMAEGTISAFE